MTPLAIARLTIAGAIILVVLPIMLIVAIGS